MLSNAFSRRIRWPLAAFGLAVGGLAHAGIPPGGAIDYAPLAAAVPSLGEWSLCLLALLLAVVAYRVLRGRFGGRLMSNLLIVGAAVAAGFAGDGVVREAQALVEADDVNMSSATGGTVNGVYWTRLTNTSGVPLQITGIHPNDRVSVHSPPPESPESPECTVGTVVNPSAHCDVEFRYPQPPQTPD